MNDDEHKKRLVNGSKKWNIWRKEYIRITPLLRGVDFLTELYPRDSLESYNFKRTDLNSATLRECQFFSCNFNKSTLDNADLVNCYFNKCNFNNVSMRLANLSGAMFNECTFINSDLSYCVAQNTIFKNSKIVNSKLEYVNFTGSHFERITIKDCSVFGISTWDLDLEGCTQSNNNIVPNSQMSITIDDIELAQFVYLILDNRKFRNTIDTLVSKVVLILGNFSSNNKPILNKIFIELRKLNLVPILFDFEKPLNRDTTETVSTLAHISKFVIADLTGARSIGHEMATLIPNLRSVNIYPIVRRNEVEYSMFNDFKAYNWVKQTIRYDNSQVEKVIHNIVNSELMENDH